MVQPGMTQSVCHLVGAGIDDAGAQEQAAGLQKLPDGGGKADDDVRHDVGHHDVIAAAKRAFRARSDTASPTRTV